MSVRIVEGPDAPELPVMLDVTTLERLVRAARLQNFRLYINRREDRAYRYRLRQHPGDPAYPAVLQSNDIGDVARFLGIDDIRAEEGISAEGQRPTLIHQLGGLGEIVSQVNGYVPLKEVDQVSLLPPKDLPRTTAGELDMRSDEFLDRAWALYQKTGQAMLHARKELYGADGDMKTAELKLSTPGRRLGCI